MTVSVVIPIYNEARTLSELVDAVKKVPLRKQVVLVDDGSTDGTWEVVEALAEETDCSLVRLRHPANRGKGAALRTGFAAATGDVVIVQDADLEYDPQEIPKVIAPILDGRADVVFGSRFMGGAPHRVLFYWHSVGNRFLTMLSNCFTNLNLTDMETCYKAFRREALEPIVPRLRQNRFGFEPEITAHIAHAGLRIYEVGISYSGRTYAEGKKIGWRDGFKAIYCIIRYNLFHRKNR